MKKILITGGSGTVGQAFIKNNYNKYIFTSYSRNEKSQVALKRKFPKVEIILGSVENKYDLSNVIYKFKPDIIIHSAALKHVDTAEKQPIELVKSNILGTKNIIDASKEFDIPITIGISTDKACNPKNLYGYSKLLMERMFLEANNNKTKFSCTRFGTVAGSNGSVIPYWLNQKEQKQSLNITHKEMKRLMITTDECSEIISETIIETENSDGGFVLTKKMKSVKLFELAKLISNELKIVGLRDGEELYEDLVSESEIDNTYVYGEYVKIFNKKSQDVTSRIKRPISSETSPFMDNNEMKKLIKMVQNNLIDKKIY